MTDLTRWFNPSPKLSIRLELNWVDAWIGGYYSQRSVISNDTGWDLWICILPCFPIHIRYTHDFKANEEKARYHPPPS